MRYLRLLDTVFIGTLILVTALSATARPAHAADDTALWSAIRTGTAFAIMRHALAPGTGDPETVVIGDCTTQGNLSGDGRAQSREIGDRFRANGVRAARVFTSAWCRCAETAALLKIGEAAVLPPLNSFFGAPENRIQQTAALKAWLAENRGSEPLVLVTHQVNITALTKVYPRSGEIVVARLDDGGGIRVLGTVYTPS
tara:strand:+ start:8320 stop:8916 length:597 start_codon:yes stop_codon:yes gene_type:complete